MKVDYDFILILSNLMDKYGNLNQESLERCKKAVEIFSANPDSFLITSGWNYRKDSKITIAKAFKKYLIENNKIPKDNILVDENSRDTVGDAVFTRLNIISKFNSRKLTIITSNYHVPRVKKIFDFVYGNKIFISVVGSGQISDEMGLREKELKSLEAFNKTFVGIKRGDIENIYKRLISKHPYYHYLNKKQAGDFTQNDEKEKRSFSS